ncbi:MAG: ATP-binding protein, partial [Fusobacteriaceae bacterium]
MEKQKCKHCQTDFIENLNIMEFLPEFVKEKIKFIPSCDCLEKRQNEEMEESEKRLELERIENKVKKFKDISVADKKFKEARFNSSDLTEGHMRLSKKYAEKFIEKNGTTKGIIFFGNCGTGKTYASACIANYLMQNGRTVLTLSLGSYLNKLRQEWSEAEMDVLKHV